MSPGLVARHPPPEVFSNHKASLELPRQQKPLSQKICRDKTSISPDPRPIQPRNSDRKILTTPEARSIARYSYHTEAVLCLNRRHVSEAAPCACVALAQAVRLGLCDNLGRRTPLNPVRLLGFPHTRRTVLLTDTVDLELAAAVGKRWWPWICLSWERGKKEG